MKKIILLIFSMLVLLTSCITVEKIDDTANVIDTTIIRTNEGTEKDDSSKVDTSKSKVSSELENKTNIDILSDKEAIKKVFDRNDRDYNLNLKGVWVATVANLDYPRKASLDVNSLKQEYLNLINNIEKMGFNAIFFQIKPGADALYETNYWPTSRYLTGQEGQKLSEDLLPFMIEEAHKRNIEFHAWINPYRASTVNDLDKIADTSIVKNNNEWTFVYGNKIFLNPGNPDVVDYVSRSIEEVVRKYDVDGIHLDDYFYPYPEKNETINDSREFELYGKNFSNINEWRRNNVNEMIKNLSVSVHKIKPNIVFGVSPFGIWRNKSTDITGSDTNGLQSYDELYADSILWMEKGWVDYIAPQIYWNIGKKGADYEVLAKWWSDQALRTDTKLYIGHGAYKYDQSSSDSWKNQYELQDQTLLNSQLKGVNGSIIFRYGTLLQFPELYKQIK